MCGLDVVFRKMLRMIVRPPSFVEWNAPWHDILHHWNGKVVALAQQHGLNAWSERNNVSNITGSLRCMLRICLRTGGSSECCFGIRLVHGGALGMIGQASSWHTRDFINWAIGKALRRIRRCGCSWVLILSNFVPFADVLVSHCLRPKEGHAGAKSQSKLYVRTVLRNSRGLSKIFGFAVASALATDLCL